MGAASPVDIQINGKLCSIRPLTLGELATLERDCLKQYRRHYLETFSENLDLLPSSTAATIMQQKMEETAKWDVDDLPTKEAYDPVKIKLTPRLRERVVSYLKQATPQASDYVEVGYSDKQIRLVAATLMDQDEITPEEYKSMTGSDITPNRIGYVHWWMTGKVDGMVALVYQCVKQSNVTREEVEQYLKKDMSTLVELSRLVETLSTPQVGNG